MAAFLATDGLRARAAPLHPGRASHRAGAFSGPRKTPRPGVTARRLVMFGGRLACRWQTDVAAPFHPPPG